MSQIECRMSCSSLDMTQVRIGILYFVLDNKNDFTFFAFADLEINAFCFRDNFSSSCFPIDKQTNNASISSSLAPLIRDFCREAGDFASFNKKSKCCVRFIAWPINNKVWFPKQDTTSKPSNITSSGCDATTKSAYLC